MQEEEEPLTQRIEVSNPEDSEKINFYTPAESASEIISLQDETRVVTDFLESSPKQILSKKQQMFMQEQQK